MTEELEYALVTPARNEESNLRRLAECVLQQSKLPRLWVIVDDASTDGTASFALSVQNDHPWILLLQVEPTAAPLEEGRFDGRDVTAFLRGVAAAEPHGGVVVKLDADVSFDRDYFRRVAGRFVAEPDLGIIGGPCFELEGRQWIERYVTGSHVRGAIRAYRWECFVDVSPLPERLGWDGMDEMLARARGWRTGTYTELAFKHHRAMGARDGARRAWAGQGEAAYYMGYRPTYLLLRTLFHSRRDRAATAMMWAFCRAALRAAPRWENAEGRRLLRQQQSIRRFLVRYREAVGAKGSTTSTQADPPPLEESPRDVIRR